MKVSKKDFKKLYDIACDNWKKKFEAQFKDQLFEDELEFSEEFLDEMQQACNESQLKVFKKIFGDYVSNDIFKVTKYSEVCKRLNEKELSISDFYHLHKDDREKALANAQIKQLERFFNKGWKVDLKDRNQHKYWPYFEITALGLVFDASCCGDSSFYGRVGYFCSEKVSNHVGKNFIHIYNKLY